MSTTLKLTTIAVVCLVIGYFAGREHLKYEVRTAMQDAASELQNSLAAAFGGEPAASRSSQAAPPAPAAKPNEPAPLTVQLSKKGFHEGTYDDSVTFTLDFKNSTGKDIRAFDGLVRFTDLLGNPIISLRLAINERVVQSASLTWEGALDYNQFIDDHQRLRSEPKENLQVDFETSKVLFADGETKTYE